MAVKVLTLAVGMDGNFAAMGDTVDQTAATRADGWTVAKTSSGNSADFDPGTVRAASSFTSQTTTPKPASFALGSTANALKTPAALNGTFASGSWTITFFLRSVTGSVQAGRVRLRVFRSVNADGSSATEVTSSTQVGSTSSAITPSTNSFTQISWAPGAIPLTNEFLFFVVAWEITTAGSSNSADVYFTTGQVAGTGTTMTTTNFTPAGSTYTKSGFAKENA